MTFGPATYGLGLLAGAASTLSPCVLPLLPVVMGAALAAHRWGPVVLAAGLALSFAAAGVFVATIGFAVGFDAAWLRGAGAVALIAFGLVLVSTPLKARFAAATAGLAGAGGALLARIKPAGLAGQFIVGLTLGLVWAPCVGPTLGATATLAAQGQQLGQVALMMSVFGIGAGLPLVAVGALSREAMARWRGKLFAVGTFGNTVLGAVLIALGVLVITGLDKRFEAYVVNHAPEWLVDVTTRF